jgi:sulfite reductase alpha subunit-like flavoprotein
MHWSRNWRRSHALTDRRACFPRCETCVSALLVRLDTYVDRVATDNTLYFGCRSRLKDQHYSMQWAAYANEGKLVYRLAPSRDSPQGVARKYVQHLIEEDSAIIGDLVGNKGAWVYISG